MMPLLIRRAGGAIFSFLNLATEAGDDLLTESGNTIDMES